MFNPTFARIAFIFGLLLLPLNSQLALASVISYHGMMILNDGPPPPFPDTPTPGGSSLQPYIYKNDVFYFDITLDLAAQDTHDSAIANGFGGVTTDAYFANAVTDFSMTRYAGNTGSFDPSMLHWFLGGPFGAVVTAFDANDGSPPTGYFNEHINIQIPLLSADDPISPINRVSTNFLTGP